MTGQSDAKPAPGAFAYIAGGNLASAALLITADIYNGLPIVGGVTLFGAIFGAWLSVYALRFLAFVVVNLFKERRSR